MDEVFEPAFGAPIDRLTPQRRTELLKTIQQCRQQKQFSEVQFALIHGVWQAPNRQLLASLPAARAKRAEATTASNELKQLAVNEVGYTRLLVIAREGAARNVHLSTEEKQRYEASLSEAFKRIAPSMLAVRVESGVTAARDAAALPSLMALGDELALALNHVPSAELIGSRTRLQERVSELDTAAVRRIRAEHRLFNPTRTPLNDIEATRDWKAEFVRNHPFVNSSTPGLASLRGDLAAARANLLRVNMHALAQQADTASTTEGLNGLPRRYLDSDDIGDARSALLSAISKRRPLVEATEQNQRAFGAVASVSKPAAVQSPEIALCDKLAADPEDPDRVNASGVEQSRIDAGQAIVACRTAAAANKDSPRLRFQLARALLKAGNAAESVRELQGAAQAGSVGALAYLSSAYRNGAGGLSKDARKAAELEADAQRRGYGSVSVASPGGAPAPSASTTGSGGSETLAGNYEFRHLMEAIYFTDASKLTESRGFTRNYFFTQAEILARECKAYKESDVDRLRTRIETQAPSSQDMKNAMEFMMSSIRRNTIVEDSQRLGRSDADIARAGRYGSLDMSEFAGRVGSCGTAPAKRYATNLWAFLSRLGGQ